MNLATLLQRQARAHPNAAAIVSADGVITRRELSVRVARLARGLRRRGVGVGDRVAVLGPNGRSYLEAYLALAWLGALAVPLNTRLAPAEIAFQLRDAAVSLWLVAESHRALADAVANGPTRSVLDDDDLLATEAEGAPVPLGGDHPLGIFYTGGTTGLPKGVVLTHGNLLANAEHLVASIEFTAEDVHLHAAPMFHLADLGYLWTMLLVGGAHGFLAAYSPEAFCEAIESLGITTTLLAPAMVTSLLRSGGLGRHDLARWRRLVYGGSPIGEETLRRALEELPCGLWQGYGQTEATHTVCLMTPREHSEALRLPRRLRACGRPIRGVEARVARDDVAPVLPGETGEVIVRGPTVMAGYWHRPEETVGALAGGWLRTGDLATVDEEGFVYILDRKKDMIISGGENVYSVEVEHALSTHPAVADAAVIAVPDELWGERVHAIVVFHRGSSATPEALQAHCRRLVGGYKVPKSFDTAEVLPRTPSGKIRKEVLREAYWRGQARRVH